MPTTNETYSGIVADTYDVWFSGETFDDTVFYKMLMDEVPGIALEIGCGTGRLLIPYLLEGYEVEGVDCSGEMLAICRRKADEQGIAPVLYDRLMQGLNLRKTYTTIYVPLASFMCLAEREEAIRALDRFYAHLDFGGQVIIPLFIPPSANKTEWTVRRKGTRSDGAEIIVSSISNIHFLEQVQTNTDRYEVIRDGHLVETRFSTSKLRWYYKYEFTMMLEKAGFRDITLFGGYGFQQVTDGQTFMIFRARK